MKNTALYPGSFDLPTLGHQWMIEKGSLLFDHLTVAVGSHPEKKGMFTLEERIEMLEAATDHLENVRIITLSQKVIVETARSKGIAYLLRGVRSSEDFVYEQTIARVNHRITSDVQTIFMSPPPELSEVSSSIVRALLANSNWSEVLGEFVHPDVHKLLETYMNQRGEK